MIPTFAGLVRDKSWKRAAGLLFAAFSCAIIVLAAVDSISFLRRIDQLAQDWEIASVFAPRPPTQDPAIAIVAIDEATLAGLTYRSPVDRAFLSELLARVAAGEPRVIGLDMLLDQPTEPAKDTALRQTLAALKVPLIASYIAPGTESQQQFAFENEMLPPRARGLANLPTDQFDTARTIFPGQQIGGVCVQGFARAIAAAAGVRTAARREVPIVWRGRPLPTPTDTAPKPFFQVSAQNLMVMPPAVAKIWLGGKVVMIGSDVTLVDRHRTPFSSILAGDEGQLPGVVIQAHMVSQLLHGTPSPLASWMLNTVLALLFAFLGCELGVGTGSLWLRGGAVGLAAALFWIGGIAFFHFGGVVIGLLSPPLAMAAGFAALDSLGGRAARQQRKFIQDAMTRYVAPDLVAQMVEDPTRLSLQGERRLMTYLFSDIQDFTTMSEKMESKDLTLLLNAYLDGMTDTVLRHGGMVDKFIGDSVFAIFNAPLDLPDHAQKAVECMLALDRFAEGFRQAQNDLGFALGVTRIGVHTGAAVIGNFGSQARFTYTAQGDAVNTASRLEGINKYLGTRLCVSGETMQLCHDIAFRPIASVVLKGKTDALDLWEPLQEGACGPDFLAAYGRAYDRLRAGEPDAASLFAALAAEYPDDPCTLLHVQRLRDGATDVKMVMTEK
jgi:adenylate cyclase